MIFKDLNKGMISLISAFLTEQWASFIIIGELRCHRQFSFTFGGVTSALNPGTLCYVTTK